MINIKGHIFVLLVLRWRDNSVDKSILIIGNGFDLAHKLPTTYIDFLEYSKRFNSIFTLLNYYFQENDANEEFKNQIDTWKDGHEDIKKKLIDLFEKKTVKKVENKDGRVESIVTLNDINLKDCRKYYEQNIWYEYFITLFKYGSISGKNWIDFEMEISHVIQWIESKYTGLDMNVSSLKSRMNNGDKIHSFKFVIDKIGIDSDDSLEYFLNRLYFDLQKLTLAMGVYFNNIVGEIKAREIEYFIKKIRPDYVISFNYTNTYEKLYCKNNKGEIPICYIHGQCNDFENNNMVLGIAEYLNEEQKNIKTDMSIFKKFIQRIRKKNDTSYKQWHEILQEEKNIFNNNAKIHVFGHSLDTTDKDILALFLAEDFADIVLYPKDEISEGKLLSNLIKIIGEDNVIKKSHSYPSRIKLENIYNH